MFTVTKRMEISACHKLDLDYESKCRNLHGHNWIVEVEISAKELTSAGMVIDFTIIKKMIHGYFDHGYLNQLMIENPTAENIAMYIYNTLANEILMHNDTARVTKITIQESEGNTACYIP